MKEDQSAQGKAEKQDVEWWHQRNGRTAAESRLAEATALLQEWSRCYAGYELASVTRVFLQGLSTPTATQAPAAWDIRGKEPVLVPATGGEPDPQIVQYDGHAWVRLGVYERGQVRISDLDRELAAWRDSYGPMGPQTPAEVPLFLRESERVSGQCAGVEIAALRAAIHAAVVEIESIGDVMPSSRAGRAISLLRAAQKEREGRDRERTADLDRELAAAREEVEFRAQQRDVHETKATALRTAIDAAIRDMLSGGHPFEKGVAKAINDLRAAQKAAT